jgi:hypothetical protein
VLGLCSRFSLVALPEHFRAFENPYVIGIALVMYVVEFVADKVPWIDSIWDAVHTVIRPLGGALVAVTALGASTPEMQVAAALLGGSVAMTTHLGKAGTRAAANTSPEPFSNWLLSFGEDAAVLGILWMAASHPLLSLALAATVIVVAVLSVRFVLRGLRRLLSRRPVAGT